CTTGALKFGAPSSPLGCRRGLLPDPATGVGVQASSMNGTKLPSDGRHRLQGGVRQQAAESSSSATDVGDEQAALQGRSDDGEQSSDDTPKPILFSEMSDGGECDGRQTTLNEHGADDEQRQAGNNRWRRSISPSHSQILLPHDDKRQRHGGDGSDGSIDPRWQIQRRHQQAEIFVDDPNGSDQGLNGSKIASIIFFLSIHPTVKNHLPQVSKHAHGLLASIEDGWHGRWPTCLRLAG
ncbi:hypothetical protein ACLOJK_027508, partial [Asimina triloba]